MKRRYLNALIPASLATDFRLAAVREGVTVQLLLTRVVSRYLRDIAVFKAPKAGAKPRCTLCGGDHDDHLEDLAPRRPGRPRKKPVAPQVATVARIKAGALRPTIEQLRQAVEQQRAEQAKQLAAEPLKTPPEDY